MGGRACRLSPSLAELQTHQHPTVASETLRWKPPQRGAPPSLAHGNRELMKVCRPKLLRFITQQYAATTTVSDCKPS